MKKICTLLLLASTIFISSCAELQQVANAAGAGTGISNNEAAAGIKEALGQGIGKAVVQLNSADGFFKMHFIKYYYRRKRRRSKTLYATLASIPW